MGQTKTSFTYTWFVELPNLGALDGYPAFHLDGMESIFPSLASSSGMREKRCDGGRVFLGIKTANFDYFIHRGGFRDVCID